MSVLDDGGVPFGFQLPGDPLCPATIRLVVADEKVFGGLLCHRFFVLSCVSGNNQVSIVTMEDCIPARLICSIVEKKIAGKYAQGETMLRSEHSLFLKRQ
jgi:hypothetical protein